MQPNGDQAILKLWSRLVCDDKLNESEHDLIVATIKSTRGIRDEISNDLASHSLLVALYGELGIDDSEEQFVQNTLRRVSKPPIQNETSPVANRVHTVEMQDRNLDAGIESLNTRERECRVKVIRRQRRTVQSWNAIGASIAVAILVGLCFAIYVMRDSETKEIDKSAGNKNENGVPADSSKKQSLLLKPVYLATLTSSRQAVWDRPKQTGDRLEAGELELLEGTARMQLNDGAIIDVTAPSSIRLDSP